jgi:kynurenine formamidase
MLMQWTDCSMANHTGTHLDAPVHFFPSGKALDDYPLDTFFGPAVLLRVSKGPFGVVTADDLINAGEDVRPGDIVLIRTGWGAKYGEPDYHTHPSFTEDAAQWLVEQGAKIVGFDQITPEIAPPGVSVSSASHPTQERDLHHRAYQPRAARGNPRDGGRISYINQGGERGSGSRRRHGRVEKRV